MSREIKFRAWDSKAKQFIFFELVHGQLGYPEFALGAPDAGGITGLGPWQQFTGLKDKNGVEIYEGDIVPMRSGKVRAIEFDNGGFKLDGWGVGGLTIEELLVIGNIYENKELLDASGS